MTKKDFVLIAAIVANSRDKDTLGKSFAHALAATNPAFNRATFLTACGVSPSV